MALNDNCVEVHFRNLVLSSFPHHNLKIRTEMFSFAVQEFYRGRVLTSTLLSHKKEASTSTQFNVTKSMKVAGKKKHFQHKTDPISFPISFVFQQ